MQTHTRSVADVWEHWKMAARLGMYPFDYTTYEDNERVLTSLTSFDREAWARAYCDAAQPFEERAREAEQAGDRSAAKDNYLHAYGLYRMARFPAPNSPAKKAAYRKSQETYLTAARFFDVPVERVEMPFAGRPGEGKTVVGYLRRPPSSVAAPVLLIWGGIDTFKEDVTGMVEPLLASNIATLAMDIPGVGDAPIPGSEDAERLWDAVFAWIGTRGDLDASRVGAWGLSTGGYWAAKIAHTHADKLAAVVNHGGCSHFAFTPEWIGRARDGSYPFELAETLACSFGRETEDEWRQFAPSLSLLDQGVLEKPCAPLLLINGVEDSIFPIADMHLLLEHGSPKTARFYPGDHMGITPETIPTIHRWLTKTLRG